MTRGMYLNTIGSDKGYEEEFIDFIFKDGSNELFKECEFNWLEDKYKEWLLIKVLLNGSSI